MKGLARDSTLLFRHQPGTITCEWRPHETNERLRSIDKWCDIGHPFNIEEYYIVMGLGCDPALVIPNQTDFITCVCDRVRQMKISLVSMMSDTSLPFNNKEGLARDLTLFLPHQPGAITCERRPHETNE